MDSIKRAGDWYPQNLGAENNPRKFPFGFGRGLSQLIVNSLLSVWQISGSIHDLCVCQERVEWWYVFVSFRKLPKLTVVACANCHFSQGATRCSLNLSKYS